MNKIEKQQMMNFLSDERRYVYIIKTLKRANIHADFYINDNDFIIEIIYPNNFTEYYIDLSSEENIKFLCELIKNKKSSLFSFSENIYKSPIFIEYFGVVEYFSEKQYGLFNKIKHEIILPETDEIRRLMIDDFDMAEKFSVKNERHGLPSYELPNFIECLRQNNGEHHRIYGYFRNNIMTAFVTAASVSEKLWHIAYIYTSPEYRQNGMALNLAKYYINEFIDKDVFISYGSAINESSQKTALSAGFELFSTTYNH